jgi:pyrimidine-specific ribonucleoside hydrolase
MLRTRRSDARRRPIRLVLLAAILLTGCGSAGVTPPPSVAPTEAVAPSPTGPVPVVLDADMSSDDAMAIPFLVREPSIDVRALNVVGTGLVHCAQGIQFATDLLAALGRTDIPVSCGGETPVAAGHEFPAEWRARADGEYGLSLRRQPASIPDMTPTERLQAVVAAAGRPMTVVATGPMTNLAEAFAADPSLPAGIDRIVAMAGAVDVPGNVDLGQGALPAEWNVYADPTAWDRVLRSGVPITMVPLDATRDAPVNAPFIAALEQDHAAAPADIAYELLMRGALASYDQFWDPLAAVIAVDEPVGTIETVPLEVVTADGPDSGRTRRADDGVPVRVATAADQPAFEARFLEGLRRGAPRDTPFSVQGTMRVTFDGTTCSDDHPATVLPGPYLVEVESTAPAAVLFAQLKLVGDATWAQLQADTARDPSDIEAPDYVDVPWFTLAEQPGSSKAVVTFEAGTYGFACLFLGTPNLAVPASEAFTVAAP